MARAGDSLAAGAGRQRRFDAGLLAIMAALAGFVVLQVLMLGRVINPYLQAVISYAGIMAISALGLNLVYGYTGQFSLGHAAFYGIGAYVSALVTRSLGSGCWILPVGIAAGALVAGVISLGIGLPILRLKSDYLGIATLGFGMIMNVLFKNSDKLIPVMGGSCGMRGIARLTSFAWVFIVAVAALVALRNLVFSGAGRALMSIREDELAAEAVGVDATRYKTLGFVIGCMYAGVAGALYAHLYSYLSPDNFDFLKSIDVLLIVVLGGLGSMSGTVVAAVAWVFLLEGLRIVLPPAFQDWRMVVYPLLLIVFMLLRPGGIFGGVEFRFIKPKGYR